MPARRPEVPGADLWAWLFVHATELTEIPTDLTPGPYWDALEPANKAKFTVAELQAYEKARDEIRQVLEIAEARWVEERSRERSRGKSRPSVKLSSASSCVQGNGEQRRGDQYSSAHLACAWCAQATRKKNTSA